MLQNFNTIIQILFKRSILAGALLGAIVLSLLGAGKTSPASFENKFQSASDQDFTLPGEDRAVVIDPDTKAVNLEAIDSNRQSD